MAKHICLFGGPGCGKSTASAGLFNKMKRKGYKVELVTEYAKDLVYSKDFMTLSDQIMVLAKQHHKWFKLEEQVDWTVSDAPFLLSSVYVQEKKHLNKEKFIEFIVETYKGYETVNIILERDLEHFQEYGRNQNLEEAIELDNSIKEILESNNIPYFTVKANKHTVKNIYKLIKNL
jgi:thymidylate kinase